MGLVGAGYAYALCKATNAALLLGWIAWRALRRPQTQCAGGAGAAAAAARLGSGADGGDVEGLVGRLRGVAAAVRQEVSEALDPVACREYVRFGVPAAVMCCLEWWAYEALVIMAGEGGGYMRRTEAQNPVEKLHPGRG